MKENLESKSRNRILIEELFSSTEDVLFADGYDDCIIGFDEASWRVVYSKYDVIRQLFISHDEWSESDCIEFAEYNIFGAYVGAKTPIWMEDFNEVYL
jgi:hypothetical protein